VGKHGQHSSLVPDVEALRWVPGEALAQRRADATPGVKASKKEGKAALAEGVPELDVLQERLFAAGSAGDTRRVLLVLQAMDTAGKGGIVRHVVGAVDPQGVDLAAFKAPTEEELKHDFLWRVQKRLPRQGHIGVFDRSHYEDVLIQRVHQMAPAEEIERRYGAIVDFEAELAEQGTEIIKVVLHVSREEQGARLAERLARPDKYWKYNPGDLTERAVWDQYQEAYRIALDRTDADAAPWYVVPADHKWYARLAVQELLVQALRRIDPQWPAADFDVEEEKAKLAELG